MTAKTSFEIAVVDEAHRIGVNVSLLAKKEVMWFNGTDVAKQFGKRAPDWLRLDATQDYIAEIISEGQDGISRLEDLVRKVHGGQHPGTPPPPSQARSERAFLTLEPR